METKKYSFKELLSVIIDNRGKTCPTSEEGFRLIATNCIKMDSLYPVFDKVRHISQDTYDNWFRSHPEPNDIIFVCKGSPGRVALTPNPVNFCIAQDMLAIRANEDIIDQKFLFALLRSKETETKMLNMHVGTLIPHFKKGDFGNLYFEIPTDRNIQKNIGEVYHKLSLKIELNRQMNQTLEAMAQALFKSWFVDFDPVLDNALEAGHEIPEALQAMAEKRQLVPNSKKLLHKNPALAAQFPLAFVFNEVLDKWVPEGWGVKTIDKISTVIGGGTPSTKIGEYFCENGIPWLSPKDLSGYEWKYISKGATDITPLGLKNSSAKLLPKGSVLFSSRAPIGYIAIAENEICTNQGFKSLIPDKGVSTEYLYQLLKSSADKIESVATGSTFKEVSGSVLKGIEVLIPSDRILEKLTKSVKASNERALLVQKETQILTQLRDALLPELISGRVRMPEGMVIH
jgi:type I restriction enzyme S subunit